MKAVVAAVAALSLASCATTALNTGKSLSGAWAALDTAAVGADAAVKVGKLKGAQAATVSADLKTASAALQAATAAYNSATSTTDPTVQIAVATTAVAEITAILAGVQ